MAVAFVGGAQVAYSPSLTLLRRRVRTLATTRAGQARFIETSR